jgi:hypothetical protein
VSGAVVWIKTNVFKGDAPPPKEGTPNLVNQLKSLAGPIDEYTIDRLVQISKGPDFFAWIKTRKQEDLDEVDLRIRREVSDLAKRKDDLRRIKLSPQEKEKEPAPNKETLEERERMIDEFSEKFTKALVAVAYPTDTNQELEKIDRKENIKSVLSYLALTPLHSDLWGSDNLAMDPSDWWIYQFRITGLSGMSRFLKRLSSVPAYSLVKDETRKALKGIFYTAALVMAWHVAFGEGAAINPFNARTWYAAADRTGYSDVDFVNAIELLQSAGQISQQQLYAFLIFLMKKH